MPRVQLRSGEALEWVEWPQDPRHELVFENAHARIYRAQFDAGQACETLFHKHSEDTVYACISSEGPGGVVLNTEVLLSDGVDQAPLALLPPEPVSFRPGLCFCHLNKRRSRIHRIQTAAGNQGTLRFVGAEVLAPAPSPAAAAGAGAGERAPAAPLAHAAYVLEAAGHPRARAYRVTAPPGGAAGPADWGFSGVVITLRGRPAVTAAGGAALAGRGPLAPGDAFWFDGPVAGVDVTDAGGGGAELLVVEWL